MPVTEIKTESEFNSAINSSGLVVVDFHAVWCGPCKMIAPVLEQISAALPEVTFVKVDVDVLSNLASTQGITAMPTIKLFKGGVEVDQIVGANIEAIRKKIEENK
ncbi:hypothetical protein BB560_003685 [Smittium megazygosporum]|uniref:Thioredoxin n=1 Tax=Smittium megazygosporum TaxID=133381 RepID=A0A2T9ZBD7_9FUNG|nr:hypothetical protein BB560_003685 [Smittium megazygosporum]